VQIYLHTTLGFAHPRADL
jgi:hypothetical protein